MTKLHSYLRDKGLSQAAFAAMVGLNQGTISKLCTTPKTPSIKTAGRIERATNGAVPVSSWIKEEQE